MFFWIFVCVACLIAFIFVFFSSWKIVFKKSRQLLDISWQLGYLSSSSAFFYRILDNFSKDSRSIEKAFVCSIAVQFIEVGFCSIASRSVKILLHALFFTCFASFCYLVIHNILFHYIHAFIWIPCAPLIIFMFLRWSFLVSCTLCQSWQKGGENVEKMLFLFMILHVRGRNTCLCKGEMCFILLGGCLPPCCCRSLF